MAFEQEPAFVLAYFHVCVAGFDVSAPIAVTVVAPDGSTVPVPPVDHPYEGVVSTSFIPDLMAPTGDWTATAVQGGLTASTPFQVLQPTVGSVRVVPKSGTPGTEFQLELAGFAPRQPATVYIYRSDDAVLMRYVTSLETTPTDAQGRAEYTLDTSRNDPPGTYCFVGRDARGSGGCPSPSVLQLG